MGRGVMDLCWTFVTWFPYIAIWWINSKVPECSMITSSVARESSRKIILKSCLNSTGHSACTSEVRDIFDRQTHVPYDWWQLMCARVLQPWDRRNSMTANVRNITFAIWFYPVQSAGAIQYTNCISAQGLALPQKCTKQSNCEALFMLELWRMRCDFRYHYIQVHSLPEW